MEIRDELIEKLSTGARHGLLGSVGGRFLGIMGNIVAARILGPSIFGVYAIGWTLFRFVSQIMPLGMERSILWFAPNYWKKDDSGFKGLLIQTVSIALGSGLLFGFALFSTSSWLATVVYRKPELETIFHLYALIFPVITLLVVISAITKVTQRIKFSVIIQDIGQPLFGLLLMGVFYAFGLRLKGVIFADVISFSVSCLVGIWIIFKLFPQTIMSKAIFRLPIKELFSYSLPAAFGGALSVYIFWIDRILIGYFCSSYENGIYLAVSQISTLFLVINAGINGIVVPLFSDLYSKGETQRIDEVYKISNKWGFFICAPLLAVILLSPGEVLSFIYGEPFKDGANILLILIVGQVINLITGSVNPLLGMTGNQKFLFKISGIVFLADIFLNILLIPKIGLVGAAISTSVSVSILYIIEVIWVKVNLKLWPYDRRFIKGIIAFGVAFSSVYGIKLILDLKPFLSLVIQTLCAFMVFAAVLVIQKLESEDRYLLSSIFGKGIVKSPQ